MLSVASGLTVIKTESAFNSPIDLNSVFQTLKNDRNTGASRTTVTASAIRYQASIEHQSHLGSIDSSGDITVGQFVELKESESKKIISSSGF